MQTCPNDRQPLKTILVRLELYGEVVRKIPVQAQNKDGDDDVLDVTECQVIIIQLPYLICSHYAKLIFIHCWF